MNLKRTARIHNSNVTPLQSPRVLFWCMAAGRKTVWVCAALIHFAGKHFVLSYGFRKCLRIKDYFVHNWGSLGVFTPQRVSPGFVLWDLPSYRGWSVAPASLSTRCGRRTERGLIQPDMKIMFAFSFFECYRLSWNSAWQFLTTRQPSTPTPSALLRLWGQMLAC